MITCREAGNKDCFEGCTHFGLHEPVDAYGTSDNCKNWHVCELLGLPVRCVGKSIPKEK